MNKEINTSCTLMDKYIRLIQKKSKTKEARIAIPMFKKWKVGDTVKFFSRRDPSLYVITKITEINYYDSFYNMLSTEEVSPFIPDVDDLNKAVEIYHSIPNYYDREKIYGVLSFNLEVISCQ